VNNRKYKGADQRSKTYQAPLSIDDTQYNVEPYTETTIVFPREGYFGNPEMAYASE